MSGVENSTYVGGLNQLNPESQDFISQGDDHLKLIKKCLLNTFPGFSRPIDGALFPWSQTPGAISVYAKFIEHTGRIGALEAFISPLHPDGAILRANNNLSDVADPAVARANLGIPTIADVLIKSQNLNDVPDKAAARINLGVPASADVLVKTQNLIDLQDVAIARQNLDVFSKAETFQKNLNLSDVVSAAVARTNLGAAAQADVLLKAQNLNDVPDKALARYNLDVPSNADLVSAISAALIGLSAVTSVNGQLGDVVLDSADVGADPAGSATTAVNAHLVDADPHPQYTTVAEAAAAAPVQSVNGMTGAVTLEEEVLQYANLAAFPVSGAAGTLYIAADTGLVYRWDGSAYVATGLQPIANNTVLGNVSGGTATPGALTKTQTQTLLDIGWVLQTRSTAAPNATIPAHGLYVTGTETDIDFVLRPKGNGAFALAFPDNAASGGNKRGTYAVDLQVWRTAATQVASGNYSVVSGQNSTASGSNSFANGTSNLASGAMSVVIGGNATTATATCSAVVGGQGGDATQAYAIALGGLNALASGNKSVVLGGDGTTASGAESVAAGYRSTASGQQSVAFGFQANATGSRSAVLGGESGSASASCSVVVAGTGCSTTGTYSATLGGQGNSAAFNTAVIAGGALAKAPCERSLTYAGGGGVAASRRYISLVGLGCTYVAAGNTSPLVAAYDLDSYTMAAGMVPDFFDNDSYAWVRGDAVGVNGADYKSVKIAALVRRVSGTRTVLYQSVTVEAETVALVVNSIAVVATTNGIELRATTPGGGTPAAWMASLNIAFF